MFLTNITTAQTCSLNILATSLLVFPDPARVQFLYQLPVEISFKKMLTSRCGHATMLTQLLYTLELFQLGHICI